MSNQTQPEPRQAPAAGRIALIAAALGAVIFVCINIVSAQIFRDARVDLTEQHLYSLSQGTKTLLANLKERYLPWALREYAKPGTDQFIDRPRATGMFLGVERADPGVFLENLVPAKKRAQRVDFRFSPLILLFPAAGAQGFAWAPRTGPDVGRVAYPALFTRGRAADKALENVMSDFRFDTAKANAGMDVMTSDTFIAALAKVRWDWRKKARETRERALVYMDQNERLNFRRIYGLWLQSVFDQGKKVFFRNYQIYDEVMCKYFEMPEGVERLRK